MEIENIHTQMLPGVSRARAVVEACSRTAMARLLSMFCILAVFVPSFFMVGVGRQLFVPLSLAVGIRHDRVVPAVQQPGARVFDVADEAGAPGRRAGRMVRTPALGLWPLPGRRAAGALAARDRISGGLAGDTISACPAHRHRDLSGRRRAALPHTPASAGGNAHRGNGAHRAARAGYHQARGGRRTSGHHQRLHGRAAVQLSGESDSSVYGWAAGGRDSDLAQAGCGSR